MNQTKKAPKAEPYRFYAEAEAYVEHLPPVDGASERVIKLRFKTSDVVGNRQSKGTTPWVTFSIPIMEQLSAQLATIVETAKRWEPGSDPSPLGANLASLCAAKIGSATAHPARRYA